MGDIDGRMKILKNGTKGQIVTRSSSTQTGTASSHELSMTGTI